jgi:hypothetical protein
MAGTGFKSFVAGNPLKASDVNTYLMQQSVMTFANTTDRDGQLSGSLSEGLICYLKDTDALQYYSGSAWVRFSATYIPPTTYTPTHNITLGTGGTLTASYQLIGKMMRVRIKVVLGVSPTMPTNPSFTIPSGYTMARTSGWLDGMVDLQQTSAGAFLGMCQAYSGTQFYARALSASGSYVSLAAITATVPFTWATNNILELDVMFEVA